MARFCYAVLQNMPMRENVGILNAMAALNCTALGARGGISTIEESAGSDENAPSAGRIEISNSISKPDG